MLQIASDYDREETSRRERDVPQLDLLATLNIFLRRWRLLAWILAAGLALGAAYLVMAPPKYTADLLLLVDTRKNSLLSQDGSAGERTIDPGLVESQVEVIKSGSVAMAVVRSLDLATDPKFMEKKPSLIKALLNYFEAFFERFKKTRPPPTQADLERAAANALVAAMKVARVGVTYVISVSFTGTNPERTAQIANAIGDAYFNAQLQSRYDTTRRATEWLQTRLKTLRDQTADAENAVQRFKAENNIIETARGLLTDQQLADANAQLATARNQTSAAKARLDRIQEVLKSPEIVNATVSDALRDDVLNRLRAQYLDLASRESDLAARFGPNHGTVVALRAQMAEINKTARDELGRIAGSSQSDYEIALSNENAIKHNLNLLVQQNDATSKAQVKLRDLESSAQTYRNLYDSMLQKMQETTQEQTSPDASARIITPAAVPDSPSAPKVPIVMAASVVGSLGFGCLIALALELLGNCFKTPDDVKKYAGVDCLGTLPLVHISRATKRSMRRALTKPDTLAVHTPVARQALLEPFSRFTETVRNVKVSVDIARTGSGPAVTGIVSSVPKEGKTTFSANLALLTAQMGHRVLLIDGDMHNPSLTRTLRPNATKGLMDVLAKACDVSEALIADGVTGLRFLPNVLSQRKANSVSLLTSDAMVKLLAWACENYDYVYVDLPPIVPVVDVKAAAAMFDSFVFIIEWGVTSRDVVRDAMISSDTFRQRVIGAVLNKADPNELKRIESYKGSKYGSYYVDNNHA